jgi:hypothetical protein
MLLPFYISCNSTLIKMGILCKEKASGEVTGM